MKQQRMLFIVGISIVIISACSTSKPYTVKSTIDAEHGQRIDRVCNHKTAVIPWYVGVAAGFFTHKYDQTCVDVVRGINDPTVEEEERQNKQKEGAGDI